MTDTTQDTPEVQVPRVDTPNGPVQVIVQRANEDDRWDNGQRVKIVYPTLTVTTRTGATAHEPVRFGGREYTIEVSYCLPPLGYRPEHGDGFTSPSGWSIELRHKGRPVDFKSPMRDKLYGLARAARDAYIAEHPEWERESRRLLLVHKRDEARDEVTKRLAEATKAAAEADAWQAELAKLDA